MGIVVKDIFTTQDGHWYYDASAEKYGIKGEPLKRYRAVDIPGAGGAHHIFVRAPIGSRVAFNTDDGDNANAQVITAPRDDTNYKYTFGWVHMIMSHDAAYNPDEGRVGPWNVWVNDVKVAGGIGLPYGWHVSTFVVVEERAEAENNIPIPAPAERIYYRTRMETFRLDENGAPVVIKEEIVWQS